MKNLTKEQKRCQDCTNLEIKGGIWYCKECFNQLCNDIDDCPEGCTLEEIEEREQKAKNNKVLVGAKSTAQRKKVEKIKKVDNTKEGLINQLAEFLMNKAENVKITNSAKVIEFDLNSEHFKLDLIRQRPKKK